MLKKTTYFFAHGIPALSILAIVFVACSPTPPQIQSHESVGSKPLHEFDPVLGYRLSTGAHSMERSFGDTTFRWLMYIDDNHERVTTGEFSLDENRPQISVFGGSFAFGQGLYDNETFAWQMQSEMPEYRIRNFGVKSYGSVHSLLQCRALFAEEAERPEIAIFMFNWVHLPRNAVSPDWLRKMLVSFSKNNDMSENVYSYPQAYVEDSELKIRNVPFDETSSLYQQEEAKSEPSVSELVALTNRVFDEILALCKSHEVRPIIAVIAKDGSPGEAGTEVVEHCRSIGFEVVDISVPLDIEEHSHYRLWGGRNGHPNKDAHAIFVEKLVAYLKDE